MNVQSRSPPLPSFLFSLVCMSQTRSAFKASEAWTDPFEVPMPLPHQTDAMPGCVNGLGTLAPTFISQAQVLRV